MHHYQELQQARLSYNPVYTGIIYQHDVPSQTYTTPKQTQPSQTVNGLHTPPNGVNNEVHTGDKNMLESTIQPFFNEIVGITTFETLYYYNFFTAVVHLCSAIVIFILCINLEPHFAPIQEGLNRNFTDVTAPYIAAVCAVNGTHTGLNSMDGSDTRTWFYIQPEQAFDLRVYFAVLITTFFSLSAVFQAGQGCFKESYKLRVETNSANFVRYIEYSLSTSLMMVAIATAIKIWDIYTHILVFMCTMLCMMLGLVADYLRMAERTIREQGAPDDQWVLVYRLKWVVLYLGWVAIFSPYIFVFAVSYFRAVLQSSKCSQNSEGPSWVVTYITLTQFFLFAIFGFLQWWQFTSYPEGNSPRDANKFDEEDPYYKELKRIGIATEHRFITLSMVAKSMLGWFIVANIIFGGVEY
jgi:hypothetical protein